jgi:hypothetical protein
MERRSQHSRWPGRLSAWKGAMRSAYEVRLDEIARAGGNKPHCRPIGDTRSCSDSEITHPSVCLG